MPCSGLTGSGLMEPVGASAPWYTCQDAFIPYIDSLPSLKRNNDGPFMMPIGDKYSDMGTVVIGKVESGCAEKGQTLAIYPNRTDVKVDTLWSDDIEVTRVTCGENVKVKLKGVEESEITPGFVLCDPNNPIKSCKTFDAQVNNFTQFCPIFNYSDFSILGPIFDFVTFSKFCHIFLILPNFQFFVKEKNRENECRYLSAYLNVIKVSRILKKYF